MPEKPLKQPESPASVADAPGSGQVVYLPIPPHGWTCYHCGETFTTWGSARDHFGADPIKTPGCRIKLGHERGLEMELRKAEASADEWRARALAGEEREESLSGRIAEYERIAGGGTHELRMKLDSMEGRVLAAEAFTAWLETVAPLTVATWRETWHRSLEIASRSVGTPSLTEHDASTVSQEKK